MNPSRIQILFECVIAGVPEYARDAILDFTSRVDMNRSGSGILHLGANDFGIYDFPLAEAWLREDCQWDHEILRLGDGSFHFVSFRETQGAVEFKLRWAREVETT